MRTNIMIDEALMKEAMTLSGLKTKRDIVHKALEDFVRNLKKRDFREIRGRVSFAAGYDHKKLRSR
jgi:Arc/MetJ family transcription regulator